MAVGEALVGAVLGPHSPEAGDPWTAADTSSQETPTSPPAGTESYQPEELLSWLLRQLLENQLTQVHRPDRLGGDGAGVWGVLKCQYILFM